MSKYNKYARLLDSYFKDAAKEQEKALKQYDEALKKAGITPDRPEEFPGENLIQQAYNQSELLKAQAELDRIKNEVWPNFRKNRDELTAQFQYEVKQDTMVDPAAVDMNGVTLLSSNIINVDEMEFLCSKYADNNTMLRLIGSKANEMVGQVASLEAKDKLLMIVNRCRYTPATEAQDAWEKLTSNSQWFTYENFGDKSGDPLHTRNVVPLWNREDNQAMVEEF